jgi:hypothetical protein
MKNNTAIVVIHGIGQQVPFETLDSFSVKFIERLKAKDSVFKRSDEISKKNTAAGAPWVENFVRLELPEKNIDIHEYYWAPFSEGKMKVDDVVKWMDKTLEGKKNLFEPKGNQALLARYGIQDSKYWGELKKFSGFLGSAFFTFRWILALVSLLVDWFPNLKFLIKLEDVLKVRLSVVLQDYVGEVAIYANSDQSSEYFAIRQKILNESQALLEQILDMDYENVLVAGHSLGSVIAYDTLNRLNILANLDGKEAAKIKKLKGLITFGSPLDLFALFFRETAKKKQYVRRQILEHLHSFKIRNLDLNPVPGDYSLADTIQKKLQDMEWLNFYCDKDPISKSLDFYEVSKGENIPLKLPEAWGEAHTGYWTFDGFYDDILEKFKEYF